MTEPVTILIPVGPNYNKEWLQEATDSVLEQTVQVNELFFIIDGPHITIPDCCRLIKEPGYAEECYYEPYYTQPYFTCSHYPKNMIGQRGGKGCWHCTGTHTYRDLYMSYWKNPCNLGFVTSFNIGMALANNNLVMFLAADDKLMPNAVEKAVQCYLEHDRKDAWYHLKYELSGGGISQIQNNVALTTKHFFLDMCGGYPPAAFVGPDAALMSCLMVHAPDRIIPVESEEPLYWIREHDRQETKIHTWKYVEEMNSIRGKLTAEFKLKE